MDFLFTLTYRHQLASPLRPLTSAFIFSRSSTLYGVLALSFHMSNDRSGCFLRPILSPLFVLCVFSKCQNRFFIRSLILLAPGGCAHSNSFHGEVEQGDRVGDLRHPPSWWYPTARRAGAPSTHNPAPDRLNEAISPWRRPRRTESNCQKLQRSRRQAASRT